MKSLADALAEPGNVFTRDDDPELVRDASPVLLKIMETLHDGLPKHKAVRESLAKNFTIYGTLFVKEDGERIEEKSVSQAKDYYARARRLFLRARAYGLEGLELASPGITAALGDKNARGPLLAKLKKEDVGLLYWTAAAWAQAISVSKGDLKLVGERGQVESLMARALKLDESYEEGAIHEFYIVYDMTRSETQGGGKARAKQHYERALQLSKNKKMAPHVYWAEDQIEAPQNKAEFVRLLKLVVACDVDADLDHRLANILNVRRAKWLLSRTDDLFAE